MQGQLVGDWTVTSEDVKILDFFFFFRKHTKNAIKIFLNYLSITRIRKIK